MRKNIESQAVPFRGVVAGVLFFASLASAQSPTTQPKSFDAYNVIAQRNIFVRDRVRPPEPGRSRERPTSRPADAPLTPQQAYVLRGIVLEEDDLRAYFEDKRTSEITRVATGALLADGRVAEILIDAVRFQNAAAGTMTWVEIGHDLTGTASASGGATSSSAVQSAPSAPVSADQAASL